MNKTIAFGVLVLLAGGAYIIGNYFSSKSLESENAQNSSSFRQASIEDVEIEGMDLPDGDPNIKGRVVSVAEDHIIISRSIIENTLSEEEREERRSQMQDISEEERQVMRAEKQVERDVNAEQARIAFSDDVKIILSSGETAKEITYDKIAENASVSIWTSEEASNIADTILVRQLNN